MKKAFGFVIATLVSAVSFGQHYYNDVVSINTSNNNYKLLKQQNIRMVKATSYEADNSPAENFLLEQELDNNKMFTRSSSTDNTVSTVTSYYENNLLKRTVDTIRGVKNTTDYVYDAAGRIQSITTSSVDPEHKGNSTEAHVWLYKQDGKPDHMLKIKNGTDTMKAEFVYDEKGNLAEERWKKRNRTIDTYYYYYNDKNQLTDIVRLNLKVRKLLPEFIFQYNEQGLVSQMLQVVPGSGNYLIWRYTYDSRGFKQKEVCFNKKKELVGRVEYTYQ
jgi:YD repeat-containing protein